MQWFFGRNLHFLYEKTAESCAIVEKKNRVEDLLGGKGRDHQ